MCITALGTGRLVPSSTGRAVTTMTRPAGEDGPASEPRDGWWATSISIRATTQTSSANAPDFFSSLLERPMRTLPDCNYAPNDWLNTAQYSQTNPKRLPQAVMLRPFDQAGR